MSNKKKPSDGMRRAQVFAMDSTLTIGGMLAIFGGLWSVRGDDPTMAVICMGSALVLLFMTTVHRFELLKGLGGEEEVKHLGATIDQAERALAGLKELAEVSTETLIFLYSAADTRKGPPSLQRAQDLADRVKKILTAVNARPDAIARILDPWISHEIQGLAKAAMQPFLELIEQKRICLLAETIAPGLAPGMFNNLKYRAEVLLSYQQSLPNLILSCKASDTFTCLRNFIGNCRDLTSSEKTQLKSGLFPFDTEATHLMQYEDFDDMSFWNEHMEYRRQLQNCIE